MRKPAALRRSATDGFLHLLGTDNTGRDVLVDALRHADLADRGVRRRGHLRRRRLVVGAFAGYFGGLTDMLISRLIEVVLLFPSFFLILTLVAMIGPSIYIIMVVIGMTGWPTIARLIRGEVLKQRAIDYSRPRRRWGPRTGGSCSATCCPTPCRPALVAAPFGIADAIITEAGLSLLGFGVRPPAPSWGNAARTWPTATITTGG